MKICISATNPCHLFDLAVALQAHGAAGTYISGYPAWRLRPPAGLPFRAHSRRTLVTYVWRRAPAALRPPDHRLFRWQDAGFDRAAARGLQKTDGDVIHAMPGQALHTFRRAKELGMVTVLNHASGPVRQQLAIVEAEITRVGLPGHQTHSFDAGYFRRESDEYGLADFHCVASSVVRRQLVAEGVSDERIWVVPYSADPHVFRAGDDDVARPPVVVFAGQINLRKGLRILLPAFRRVRESLPQAELHLYGAPGSEMSSALPAWRHEPGVSLFGNVTQHRLAAAFQRASVLVLPSWEDAFGLVVPQALQCGLPCVVSDSVGAKDLIVPRANGTVVPTGDEKMLADALILWLEGQYHFTHQPFTWHDAASRLINATETAKINGHR